MRGNTTAIGVAACLAIALTGCGSDTEPTATKTSTTTAATVQQQSLVEWGQGELDPVLDRLGDAFTWAGGALQSLDLADARAAGREFNETVDDLEAILPAPNPSVTADMEDAVDNFRDYADGLMGVSPRVPASEIDKLTDYQDAGMAALTRVVDAVKASRN